MELVPFVLLLHSITLDDENIFGTRLEGMLSFSLKNIPLAHLSTASSMHSSYI